MSRIKDSATQQAAINALYHNDTSDHGTHRDNSDTISIRSRHTLRAFGADPQAELDEEDPWSAIPRPLSSSTTLPSSIPTLTAAQRKQLLLGALLRLFILFFICLFGLVATLWLALPIINPQDKPNFKLPKSFDDLKNLNTVLQHYKHSHFAQVLLCWIVVYIFLQAFSIPGSMYMSILAGALFGVPIALPLVCASVATGASICYLISKTLGVVLVALPSWQKRVDDWKLKLAQHEDNLLSYLIVIRMMPLPPHNIVNILSPHLGIPLGLFWLSTFFGIFAVSVIHTTIGEKLDQMTSADDFNLFSLRNVLLLVGVCVAVLIPVVIKRFSSVEALESSTNDASSHGAIFLSNDQQADQDAQQLPDSFRRNLILNEDFSDDDELPHRNLDTNNIISSTEVFEQGGAQESFPTWRDRNIHNNDDDDDQGDDGEAFGRGGVFTDRSNNISVDSNTLQEGQKTHSTGAKLKAWIGSSTGIKL
ncbi:uncharacterized protein UTRI_06010 [Ustilago trichophora]|uniref:VTT domain-containing protein n=1 Tax=Ustilago trichophora TaxID=86804 RepID=A0A5C3EKZ4_9BASI|nr:uncharacterized protein UTRI_06010 [Ustilago trichophora]